MMAYREQGGDAIALALANGDDYELCFTVPPAAQFQLLDARVPSTQIGIVEVEPGLRCVDAAGHAYPVPSHGYDHFAED